MWFIRCRLPFRKDFVQYITKVRACIHMEKEVHSLIHQVQGGLRDPPPPTGPQSIVSWSSQFNRFRCCPAFCCFGLQLCSCLCRVCAPTRCCRSTTVTSKARSVHEAPASTKGPKGKAKPALLCCTDSAFRCLCGPVELGLPEVTSHKYFYVLVAATPFRLPWFPSFSLFCSVFCFFQSVCFTSHADEMNT